MNKYLSEMFCLFLFFGIKAQDKVIKNLETRIEAAALKEDYAKADKLTKELDARVELEKVIVAKDYKRAAELKEEISNLENAKPFYSNIILTAATIVR
ncbi:MAG: hypothetical protein ACI9O4_000579 [Chitinophagales bacterium]|jgi:hypothetical protein